MRLVKAFLVLDLVGSSILSAWLAGYRKRDRFGWAILGAVFGVLAPVALGFLPDGNALDRQKHWHVYRLALPPIAGIVVGFMARVYIGSVAAASLIGAASGLALFVLLSVKTQTEKSHGSSKKEKATH